jgi:hypothetical protein
MPSIDESEREFRERLTAILRAAAIGLCHAPTATTSAHICLPIAQCLVELQFGDHEQLHVVLVQTVDSLGDPVLGEVLGPSSSRQDICLPLPSKPLLSPLSPQITARAV